MRIAPILFLLPLAGCSITGACEDQLIESKADLAGKLVAYRYVRGCGATARDTMNIAIGERSRGLEGAQRVFTANDDGGAETEQGHLWVEMHWTQVHHLSVAYAEAATLFKSDPRAGAAEISYRATGRIVAPPVP